MAKKKLPLQRGNALPYIQCALRQSKRGTQKASMLKCCTAKKKTLHKKEKKKNCKYGATHVNQECRT